MIFGTNDEHHAFDDAVAIFSLGGSVSHERGFYSLQPADARTVAPFPDSGQLHIHHSRNGGEFYDQPTVSISSSADTRTRKRSEVHPCDDLFFLCVAKRGDLCDELDLVDAAPLDSMDCAKNSRKGRLEQRVCPKKLREGICRPGGAGLEFQLVQVLRFRELMQIVALAPQYAG